MEKTTVVIIVRDELDNLRYCIEKIVNQSLADNVIVLANGSQKDVADWLEEQQLNYIWFDEGIESYSKIINILFQNFKVGEYLIVFETKGILGTYTIKNLVRSLESNVKTGVVGVMCNLSIVGQFTEIHSPEELEEMESRTEWNDESDDIIIASEGICYGLSRSLIEKNGFFDESFVTLEKAMIDYQLQALQNGFCNKICGSSYMYINTECRNNWDAALEECDMSALKKKWDMNYFNFKPNLNLEKLINRSHDETFSVLEIGCDMGANLLKIKNMYPNCEIHGIEINEQAVKIGRYVADIQLGNIEEYSLSAERKYDYIIFGDVLEHLHDPAGVIGFCAGILNENGHVLASIPNLMHISVMHQLINGHFRYEDTGLLDRTHIHFFTYREIVDMFAKENYEIDNMMNVVFPMGSEEKELVDRLMELSTETQYFMYETFQYLVSARLRSC